MSIERYGEEMTDAEIAAFMADRGVGTLSFGDDSGGYGIPMSFGYDETGNRCILQMAIGEENLKTAYIEAGNPVTLSAFEWNAIDDWRSVVLRGALERIEEADQAKAAGIFAAHAKIASLEVFQQSLDQIDLVWYELRIEDAHGRQSTL